MTTNTIETTTAHDFRPTHSAPPAWLTEAREAMNAAWDYAGECTPDEYPDAERQARDAQEWYNCLYGFWMAGGAPTVVTANIIEFSF